jgi:hypothetical protein
VAPLNLAALGTSLLLLRFLLLLWQDRETAQTPAVSPLMWLGWSLCWGALLLCGSGLVTGTLVPATRSVALGSLAQQLWPLLGGGLIGTLVWRSRRHRPPLRELPAGDILVLCEALWERVRQSPDAVCHHHMQKMSGRSPGLWRACKRLINGRPRSTWDDPAQQGFKAAPKTRDRSAPRQWCRFLLTFCRLVKSKAPGGARTAGFSWFSVLS